MCVAVPGRVVSTDDKMAEIDFSGNIIKAYRGLVDVKPGDYALVHAGCIIQILKETEAEEILELMGDADVID